MTLQNPKDLGPDPNRNRPWYRDDSDMVSGGVIFTLVVGTVLAFGMIMYAMSDHSIITAHNPSANSPMSTTGQGGDANLNPAAPQSKPPLIIPPPNP
jgi:hypothetical protein